jgi:FtsX-like permease family protein
VLRVTAGVQRLTGVTVLGVDPQAVERLNLWRPSWAGGAGRDQVASAIDPGAAVTLRSAPIPGDVISLGVGPGLVSFAAIVETPRGDVRRIVLGDSDPKRATTLRERAPRGSRLVTLEVVPPRIIERGSDAGTALRGVSRLTGPLAVSLQDWIGLDGVGVQAADHGIDLRYVLTPQRRARLRARQTTDATPPEVLATPVLAELAGGVGGLLPLQVGGERIPVRVARVVERFPGASGDAVVVGDRGALATAINAAVPGAARENEVWLEVPAARRATVAAALQRPPFAALSSQTRADLEADARRDPIANGTLIALAAAALVALVLAAVGLTLAVRADLRDDRGELYDLEAQGAAPSMLRRVVRARALTLSLVGLVAGAVTGVLLVLLVTRMVAVTARGGIPEPPLVTAVDPIVVVTGIAAYLALAVLLVGAATRRAFRSARGPQAGEDD